MNNMVEFHLNTLEKSVVSANSVNYRATAELAEPCLRMAALDCGSDPELDLTLRSCEDAVIALCHRLSEIERITVESNALRAEALLQLEHARIMIKMKSSDPATKRSVFRSSK